MKQGKVNRWTLLAGLAVLAMVAIVAPKVFVTFEAIEGPITAADLVADGRWKDVLPLVPTSEKAEKGTWEFADGNLKCTKPTFAAKSILRVPPVAVCDARVRLIGRSRTVVLWLPIGAKGIMFCIEDVRNQIRIKGHSFVPMPGKLGDGKEHDVFVSVGAETVSATWDGQPIYEVPRSTIGEGSTRTDPPPVPLGLGVHEGTAEFRSFEIRFPKPQAAES